MKYYYREHWDENNNDNDDFILSVFFLLQWCGTMGTESQGYVGFDDDCTDDVEELEQKPGRFKTRSKMTLMAWIEIMIFFFSFPFLQWCGTRGSRKPRRWQILTTTAGNTCCVWRQGKLAPVSCCHLVTSLNAARHLKWWPSDWQGFDGRCGGWGERSRKWGVQGAIRGRQEVILSLLWVVLFLLLFISYCHRFFFFFFFFSSSFSSSAYWVH